MTKIAAIIGGVLLMAGVALAGTLTSLDKSNSPTIKQTPAAQTTTQRQEDRGRELEQRGRENEVGEDLRGPCDEAEHASDPRCTGAAVPRADDDDDAGEDRGHDGNRGSGERSGHGGGDRSGHGGGDGGGQSGHGGGGDD